MSAAPAFDNWQAQLDLDFMQVGDRTRMIPNKRFGPLSVQRAFYPEGATCHAYLLHPPGGVAGGDRLTLNASAQPGSTSLLTTPGATKFYHNHQRSAVVEQNLHLLEDSALEYLPQENIYFPGAWVDMHTHLSLNDKSRGVVWEKHCFGRPANHENFDSGSLTSRLIVDIDDETVLHEIQRIDAQEIARASGMRQHAVMGTMIIAGHEADKELIDLCRELEPEDGLSALSQVDTRLLVARYLGDSTRHLNDYFVALWQMLRPTILGRPACHPRIWNT